MRRMLLATVSTAALAATVAGTLAAPAAAAASHIVTMRASRQHKVTVAAHTGPGWTQLRNPGRLPLLVFAPRGHAGAGALARDLNRDPSPSLEKQFRIATTVDYGSSAYVLLQHGVYFVTDGYHVNTPYRSSQIAALHVSGARVDTALPKSNRIAISANYDVHAAHVLSAGRDWVTLVSAASREVNVIAVPVDASTSKKAIDAFLKRPSYKRVGTLAKDPYYALAQEAAPKQTIVNDDYAAKGRWMIVTQGTDANGHHQGTLHQGQAELVTLK